ncbi:MAG TPA: hypothetical protein VEV83_11545 [Parafilimonas sp.]|nr:hypothetical protein [Parafilimonas sp.]
MNIDEQISKTYGDTMKTLAKMIQPIDTKRVAESITLKDASEENLKKIAELIKEGNKKDWTQKHPVSFAVIMCIVSAVLGGLVTHYFNW